MVRLIKVGSHTVAELKVGSHTVAELKVAIKFTHLQILL